MTVKEEAHQRPAVAKPKPKPKAAMEMLPEEFQTSIRYFHGFYSDAIRSLTGIATRILWWKKEEGLTHAELKKAMAFLMTPERSMEIDNSPKVLAALSAAVAEVVRARRTREKEKRIRDEVPVPVDTTRIKEMLANFGKMPATTNGQVK